MSEIKCEFYIIVTDDYIEMSTPYSNNFYYYDCIDAVIDDLKYCLECEVKRYGKKNEKVQR